MATFSEPEYTGISNADLHWRTLPDYTALDKEGAGTLALAVLRYDSGRVVLCQAAPWMFDYRAKPTLRTTYRRNVFLVSRLLANLGARSESGLLARFAEPAPVHDWALPGEWKGLVDRDDVGQKEGWERPELDEAAWRPIQVPGAFDKQIPELADYDGLFWYCLHFRKLAALSREGLTLQLGPVDDESWVWLNGKLLGEVTKQTNPEDYWSFPRSYALEPGMLSDGADNVLVVRCRDTFQSGGIMAQPRLTAKAPWLTSYYLQEPEAGDDPYRYYRW